MAEINNVIAEASQDLQTIEDFVNLPADSDVFPRLLPSVNVGTLAGARQAIFEAGGLPATPFETRDKMIADGAALVDGDYALVTDDNTVDNIGYYEKRSGQWVQVPYGSNSELRLVKKSITDINKNFDGDIIPVLVDGDNKVLLGYDKILDKVIGAGVGDNTLKGIQTNFDPRYISVLVDDNNNVLIGYDTLEDKAVIAGIENTTATDSALKSEDVNHYLFYGQSLAVGATATTILSASQPYSNLTFNTSPRMDTTATSVIPLIEQFNNPASDGSANRGETVCSGAANYASRAMMLENSISPDEHVIFASTAGHGGYRVNQLEKGTAWYSFFENHVRKAKELNAPKTHKVQVVGWVQGENDAVASEQTPYSTYKAKMLQLQIDMSGDIKRITKQFDDVDIITYQMSYAAKTWSDVALAQLDLVRESDKFHMATPIYHMPYATDAIHLTNVGYKWLGAYFGRAYKQRVIDNKSPDYINPLSAKVDGNTVTIKFDVPKKPLVIDTTTLLATTDNGFKVFDKLDFKIPITSMVANDDSVVLTLANTPTDDIFVRYALDYLATGINLAEGASGNLRDSTADTVTISGSVKPLYHVCPHFKITAFFDKGI